MAIANLHVAVDLRGNKAVFELAKCFKGQARLCAKHPPRDGQIAVPLWVATSAGSLLTRPIRAGVVSLVLLRPLPRPADHETDVRDPQAGEAHPRDGLRVRGPAQQAAGAKPRGPPRSRRRHRRNRATCERERARPGPAKGRGAAGPLVSPRLALMRGGASDTAVSRMSGTQTAWWRRFAKAQARSEKRPKGGAAACCA
jgi:hypothetical protein